MLRSSTRRTRPSARYGCSPRCGATGVVHRGTRDQVTAGRPDRQHQMYSDAQDIPTAPTASSQLGIDRGRGEPIASRTLGCRYDAALVPRCPRLDLTGTFCPPRRRPVSLARGSRPAIETRAWLLARTGCTRATWPSVPGREQLTERLSELLTAGEVGPPVWRGDQQFFTRRGPGKEHAVLYTVLGRRGRASAHRPDRDRPGGLTTLDGRGRTGRAACGVRLSVGGSEESVLAGHGHSPPARTSTARSNCATPTSRGCRRRGLLLTRRLAPRSVPAARSNFHRRVYLHRVGRPAE